MEHSLHLPLGSSIRGNKNKSEKELNLTIVSAHFLGGYKIFLRFSNGLQRIVNFQPIFIKYVKGYYSKYFLLENFKKFIVKNGNIYWGKNEEVIFPVSFLYNSKNSITQKEEILYIV